MKQKVDDARFNLVMQESNLYSVLLSIWLLSQLTPTIPPWENPMLNKNMKIQKISMSASFKFFNISHHKRNRLEFANNSDLCKHVLHDHKVEQYTMGQLLPEVVFAIMRLSMLSRIRIRIMKLTGWLRNSYSFDFIKFLTPLCNRKLSTRKQMCSQPSSQLENELYLLYLD